MTDIFNRRSRLVKSDAIAEHITKRREQEKGIKKMNNIQYMKKALKDLETVLCELDDLNEQGVALTEDDSWETQAEVYQELANTHRKVAEHYEAAMAATKPFKDII